MSNPSDDVVPVNESVAVYDDQVDDSVYKRGPQSKWSRRADDGHDAKRQKRERQHKVT